MVLYLEFDFWVWIQSDKKSDYFENIKNKNNHDHFFEKYGHFNITVRMSKRMI